MKNFLIIEKKKIKRTGWKRNKNNKLDEVKERKRHRQRKTENKGMCDKYISRQNRNKYIQIERNRNGNVINSFIEK